MTYLPVIIWAAMGVLTAWTWLRALDPDWFVTEAFGPGAGPFMLGAAVVAVAALWPLAWIIWALHTFGRLVMERRP